MTSLYMRINLSPPFFSSSSFFELDWLEFVAVKASKDDEEEGETAAVGVPPVLDFEFYKTFWGLQVRCLRI
jgi:hypothetical protein